jgi:hypothetical protein
MTGIASSRPGHSTVDFIIVQRIAQCQMVLIGLVVEGMYKIVIHGKLAHITLATGKE